MVRERNPCVCVSTRTGTLIIGWLAAVSTVLVTIFYVHKYAQLYDDATCGAYTSNPDLYVSCLNTSTRFIVEGFSTFAVGIVALLPPISVIYGTFKNRVAYLIPFIVYQMLGHIALVVYFFGTHYRHIHPLSCLLFTILFGFWSYGTAVVYFHYIKVRNEQRTNGAVKTSAVAEASNV